MYDPVYSYSDRLVRTIAKIEEAKVSLELNDLGYDLKTKLTEETKSLNIFHIANMLGFQITLKDAQKIVQGRKLESEDPKFNVLTNFRNVLEFNNSSASDSYVQIDLNLLLHLNKIVLTDWRESWDVKLRAINEIADLDIDGWADYWDREIDANELPTEISGLIQWYKISFETVHPIISTAVVVHRLIQLAPFNSGNKLTIIALADYMLTKAGYTEKAFLPLVRLFDQNDADFKQSWEFAVAAKDLGMWIEKFVMAIETELSENLSKAEKVIASEKQKSTNQPFLDLNKRQIKILRYLQTIPTVKREDYCAMMDVSTMTAFRDMRELVRKKLVKVEGRGRGTKYKLATRV